MPSEAEVNNILISKLFEVLTRDGLDCMPEIFATLLNEAMKIERSNAIGASPYERSEDRQGYANGFKERTIATRMGSVRVQIPQVRGMSFYPQSLEKGCRSEKALKLALAEMYINGVSTRRVTEITEQLCGHSVSSTQVSRATATLDEELEKFRTRSLSACPYLYLDARYEKIRHNGMVRDAALLIAVGVNLEGKREVLGLSVSLSEAEIHWRGFLKSLQTRGLNGLELIISDDHAGMKAARKSVFPSVPWQRCQFHFAQNAQHYAPKKSMKTDIAFAVRSIFDAVTIEDADEKVRLVVEQFKDSAPEFATWLEENVHEALTVHIAPKQFQKRLRTVNSLENLNREIKRRTNVARIFPSSSSLLRLATALLVEVNEKWMCTPMPYLNMQHRKL